MDRRGSAQQHEDQDQDEDRLSNPWQQHPELATDAAMVDIDKSDGSTRRGDSRLAAPLLRQHADEAFSSSSDDDDVAPLRRQHMRRLPPASSEFDKALLTGVPSTGAASFDGSEFTVDVDVVSVSLPHTLDVTDDATATTTTDEQSSTSQFSRKSQLQHVVRRPMRPPAMDSSNPRPPVHLQMHHPHQHPHQHHHHPAPVVAHNPSIASHDTTTVTTRLAVQDDDLSNGVLPDVLMSMRQRIESLTLFDSEMMKLAEGAEQWQRDSLKRSSQQSLSAAVLVSLAHKRYERRRLAAMEIEKVVRGLAQQQELERIRAILLLLSDDYVRSTSEDARKGGVVALAACGIGLKKATDSPKVAECRDLILASVVHACQDHSQRVRYYATESLFNVVKVNPTLAVQHFFILFEILRSLYADVDVDVRSGAELLDKKLKEVIVGAINSGSFSTDACVPIFGRFVYMRNKATQRLTLTWLQELNEKLLGNPVLEFLHLFLGGIFAMIADPNIQIRQSALAFLQSVLPKLLMTDNDTFDDKGASMKVDFDKLIQSLVTTLEHPDPFVRKVAMYWMSRIVKAYMGGDGNKSSPASMSVRNSLPHVLPGILLSIGDTFHTRASTKDSFLPDQTTHSLAQQTNACLQASVQRDGKSYATHLDGFLMALREELDSPGKDSSAVVERNQYRLDVTTDGSGIESTGWFRASKDTAKTYEEDATSKSRLCALEWVIVLYESVVPDVLKAEFAREFVSPIIHQLVGNPPELIIIKSLEVLAKITVPVPEEKWSLSSKSNLVLSSLVSNAPSLVEETEPQNATSSQFPESALTDADASHALEILDGNRAQSKSRDRGVFAALIQLHAHNHQLLADLSRVIQIMCSLQPPEFVFVSFAMEMDLFVRQSLQRFDAVLDEEKTDDTINRRVLSPDLNFVSSFVQQMSHVLLATDETKELRELLRDCIGKESKSERDKRRTKLFHILLYSFSHNLAASTSLCLWAGAYRTASCFLQSIDPLDINLVFLLEVDQMVELLERPLSRHLHLRMLEADENPHSEGSGAMLFRTLALILMVVPQSTCYRILRDRLVTISRFRQTALSRRVSSTISSTTLDQGHGNNNNNDNGGETWLFASRVLQVRKLHCDVAWDTIRSESLETSSVATYYDAQHEIGSHRRDWLGFANKEEEAASKLKFQQDRNRLRGSSKIEELGDGSQYDQFQDMVHSESMDNPYEVQVHETRSTSEATLSHEQDTKSPSHQGDEWKSYWEENAV